jgi:hypothetical protein
MPLSSPAAPEEGLARQARSLLRPKSRCWREATLALSTSTWAPSSLSTLDSALMLGAVIMSLLPQSDYFGSQQPIPLLERGLFLPQSTCLRLARLLGDHHACRATIAGCLRRVPQKIAIRRFFFADAFTEYLLKWRRLKRPGKR